jgi:hypothetical protein
MKDLSSRINPVRALAPVATPADNTAQVTAIIDRAQDVGYESLTYIIATGSLPDVDATFTVLVEHGDAANLSDAAAVPDEQLVGLESQASFIFSDDNKCFKIGYVGPKRYTRLTITPGANASASLLCVIALLGHPHATPTPAIPV